ncbi:MAG TPA: hypothetical protein VHR42_06270 [Clostridia bacterium]|nr:hypothetical protein [Clostridia bacterium]
MTAYQVIKDMKNAGFRATIVPAESVRDIRVEMESLIVSGALDAGIVAKYGRHFQNDFISRYPAARSIILVAAPCPVHRLTFSYHGTCCEAVIPPGYARMGLKSAVEHQVSGLLRQSGYSCEKLEGVPLKLIAVKSGLCLYGRNNITYCEGLGSYIRLFGFVSDIQAPQDALWRPAERMPECADCGGVYPRLPQRMYWRSFKNHPCRALPDLFERKWRGLSRLAESRLTQRGYRLHALSESLSEKSRASENADNGECV